MSDGFTRRLKVMNGLKSARADDTAIYSNITPPTDYQKILEESITVIQNNLAKIKLELSPQKTALIHFNNKNIAPGETKIYIANHEIKSRNVAD